MFKLVTEFVLNVPSRLLSLQQDENEEFTLLDRTLCAPKLSSCVYSMHCDELDAAHPMMLIVEEYGCIGKGDMRILQLLSSGYSLHITLVL